MTNDRWPTTVTETRLLPEEGQIVHVRQRQFVVNGVTRDALATHRGDDPDSAQHLVSLTSVEDDGLGEEIEVIWELEPGARVLARSALPTPTGLDRPDRLEALLNAVRWVAASTADHRNVQAPFRSGIEIDDYQLDPVVRSIAMPRANLLIADDVGLGKTIEAGLIILELMIRHRANRVLVACPAGLQLKWQREMREKFGLEFRIVDSELMRKLRRERGIHANPWQHFPRLITSIDYLKRDRPLQLFRETLPAPGESIIPRRYDILVLDEAQNCAPSGAGRYATDSQRTTAIREIAPHFEHRLFLSATPHNGYQESFSALLELLDDQRFARGTQPDEEQLRRVMVRRLKTDIPPAEDGTPRFPTRKLIPLEVPYTDEEREIHQLLVQYGEVRLADCQSNRERFATEFVLKTLKKRLFSCPAAFASTLRKHLDSISRRSERKPVAEPTYNLLAQRFARVEEDYADEEEQQEATEDALDSAGTVFRPLNEHEQTLVNRMAAWAAHAAARADSKAGVLVDWLHSNLKPHGVWNTRRVVIFTEYRQTQMWLIERLAVEGLAEAGRLEAIYGGMVVDERERIKAHFQHDPEVTPVRILIATECAGEGIDLQRHCDSMIHYEIPWNPNRLEQRNGRIDRRGQRSKEVLIHHFVGVGYQQQAQAGAGRPASQLEGDLEFLMRAAEKVEAIRKDLGKVGPVIATQVEEAMLGRRTQLETRKAEEDAQSAKVALRFERDLAARIARLRERLEESREALRLRPDNVRSTVEVALDLAEQPQLMPTSLPNLNRDGVVFQMPPLRGSWQRSAEGLQHPVTEKIRPITFDHGVAEGRDDVVLVHLNHRLVQMCLRLLRAEIWASEGRKKLHRITARYVRADNLESPVVVVHGRLMLIGAGRHRLHEEMIAGGGTVRDGRWERLPQGRMEELLRAAGLELPPADIHPRLLDFLRSNEDKLVTALEARMRERVDAIERDLQDRCKRELRDIESIMTELASSIREQVKTDVPDQMYFDGWAPDEKEQLERNMAALQHRLETIPKELEEERSKIEDRYADRMPRMFPLAETILVPEGWRYG